MANRLGKSTRAYLNLLLSLGLSAVVLAVSLLLSKGVEVLADHLWSKPGEQPPVDVPLLITVVGIITAIGIIGFVAIDTLITWMRAWKEGRE